MDETQHLFALCRKENTIPDNVLLFCGWQASGAALCSMAQVIEGWLWVLLSMECFQGNCSRFL
jgi:hypothetical protein